MYIVYIYPLKPSETKVIHTYVVDKCYIVPLGWCHDPCHIYQKQTKSIDKSHSFPNALSEVKSFEENCHFLLSMLSLGYFGGRWFQRCELSNVQGLAWRGNAAASQRGGNHQQQNSNRFAKLWMQQQRSERHNITLINSGDVWWTWRGLC